MALDITKLVVGQEAHMVAGPYGLAGKVVEINASGVVVEDLPDEQFTDSGLPCVPYQGGNLYHFDASGKGREEEGYEYAPGATLTWQLMTVEEWKRYRAQRRK